MPSQVSNPTSYAEAAGPAYDPALTAYAPAITWADLAGILTPGDGVYASTTTFLNQATLWLRGTGYGFTIPDNAVITGVELRARIYVGIFDFAGIPNAHDAGVKLIVNNNIQGNELGVITPWDKHMASEPTHLAFNASQRIYGGDGEMWGLALTPADVNAANFGVAMGVANGPTGATLQGVARADSLSLVVYYTIPAPVDSDVTVTASISSPGKAVVVRASISNEPEADVLITASIGFGVDVTTPAAGCPTVTTSAMAIAWEMSATAQVGFRIQIFEDATAETEIYDSGFIGGSQQNFTVPVGILPAPATGLYLRVTVTNDGGVTVSSPLQCFDTSFPTSVNITGVETVVIGGCEDPRVLPGIRIKWNVVTEGPGETFLTYAIRRREEGTVPWTTIAEVGDISTTSIVDYNVAPVVRYEYSVVWRATSGASTLQSADTSPAPIGTVDFEFNWLHTASLQSDDDEFAWVRMDSFNAEKTVDQDIRYVQPWGRDLPTGYVGQQLATLISVPLREDLLRSTGRWDKLRELVRLQRDRSAVLQMRFGRSRESYFVTISGLGKTDSQKTTTSRIRMAETFYEEGVF